MNEAVYGGSFDPITKGHLDIIEQALKVFDRVTVAIGDNPAKAGKNLFERGERVMLINDCLAARGIDPNRVNVDAFAGTLIDYALSINATAIMRGLRQISDFNDEFVLHAFNERMSGLPQVYFICRHEYLHVSSSSAKMLASYGKDISWMVDPPVEEALKTHYRRASW